MIFGQARLGTAVRGLSSAPTLSVCLVVREPVSTPRDPEDFADVLAHAGYNGTQVLAEMISSMSLKRGNVGTKFIRSFHDRKFVKARLKCRGAG
jgi:hypothetical protein